MPPLMLLPLPTGAVDPAPLPQAPVFPQLLNAASAAASE